MDKGLPGSLWVLNANPFNERLYAERKHINTPVLSALSPSES